MLPNCILLHPKTAIIAAAKSPIARKARISGGDEPGEKKLGLLLLLLLESVL